MASKYDGTWGNDPLDIRCIRLDAEREALSEARRKRGRKSKPRRLPRSWQPKSLSELYQYSHKEQEWWDYCSYRLIPKGMLLDWKYDACDIVRKSDNKIVDNTCSAVQQARDRITEEHDGRFDDFEIYIVSSNDDDEKIRKVEI